MCDHFSPVPSTLNITTTGPGRPVVHASTLLLSRRTRSATPLWGVDVGFVHVLLTCPSFCTNPIERVYITA